MDVEVQLLLHHKDIADALDLPPIKLHCSVLAEDAIKRAMINYEEKNPKSMIGHNGAPDDRAN